MAIKNNVVIEVEKNEQKYVFHMPPNRPLQECYDAAQEVAKELVEFADALKKAEDERKDNQGEAEKAPLEEKDGEQPN